MCVIDKFVHLVIIGSAVQHQPLQDLSSLVETALQIQILAWAILQHKALAPHAVLPVKSLDSNMQHFTNYHDRCI